MTEDFLKLYTEYASEVTDAPVEFHNFVGLLVLAAALGKRVFFRHSFPTYLNIWLVLLAPSSAFRKSTALKIGKRLLLKVNADGILPTDFTQERICKILSKSPQGIFFYSEFMSLTGMLQKDYHAGTKAFLTDIYDCPPVYVRKTMQEDIKIVDPVISMGTATTSQWFLTAAKEADMYGGFLARFIYVPAYKKLRTMAFPRSADANAENRLGILLNEIRTGVEGEVTFSPEAHEHYEKWHTRFEPRIGGNKMSGFQTRLTVYCLKFACLYEISATRSRVVSLKSMERACTTTDWLSNQLRKLHDEEFTHTAYQSNRKKVLQEIMDRPGITRSDLLRAIRIPSKFMREVIQTLIQEERIELRNEVKEGKKKPSACYYEITS